MKKRYTSNNIYDKYITMDNLYNIYNIVKKTCKNKKELYLFSLNLNINIYNIYYKLKNRTYKHNKYRTFMIFEPKPRLIMSESIEDKIVNHFITYYYLIPYLDNSLIDSNIATRKNKGCSYGNILLKNYLNKLIINNKDKEIYCLKIDISKYFYNIDHNILINMLSKKIYDKDVISLIKSIISETNNDYINNNIDYYNKKYNTDIPYYKNNKGLSIGAMTSQFLAIFYLNNIDHYIKEKLRCKYYIRYMDDFIILDTNKDRLKEIFKSIEKELNSIKLNINKKSNIYKVSKSFNFLGYSYKINNIKLIISIYKKTYYKMIKRLRKLFIFNLILFNKSLSSYYGLFKNIYNLDKGNFKLSDKTIYNILKYYNKNKLIIIKDKKYYKSYLNDAKTLYNLFNYKYIDNCIIFNIYDYDKIINIIKNININFMVINKQMILLDYENNTNKYSYIQLYL